MSSTMNTHDTKSQKSLDRSATRNKSGVIASNTGASKPLKSALTKQLSKKAVGNKDKKENKNSLVSSNETQKLLVNALLNKTNNLVRNDSKKTMFNLGGS